jgi:class 3 adenylate cyclase/tetratricopeptide (TPR) repeat protein
MSETLRLEAAAAKGEVVVSASLLAAVTEGQSDREGGIAVHAEDLLTGVESFGDEVTVDHVARFVSEPLRRHFGDYANQGAQHRQAAIGFVGIDGVDDYLESEGGPATAAQLGVLMDRIEDVISPTGVSVIDSDMAPGGVKLLIGAGVPAATGDHADALTHAMLAIAAIDTPFPLRQGMQTGNVFAGFLGADHRRTFSVMADAVNTAARMSSSAGPGEIIAVTDVRRRARAVIEGVDLPPMQVKGKVDPVLAFRVTSIGRADERDSVSDIGFVGRTEELAVLRSAVDAGQSAAIVGPAGSGKTRLSGEAIQGEGTLVAAGGRYTSATPYAAFWAPLRAALGVDPRADAVAAGQELLARLSDVAPGLLTRASLIAPAFAAELPESDEVAAIADEYRRSETQRSMTELLQQLDPPVTAILTEDTQWFDDSSAELVDHLERDSASAGWAVIRSSRKTPTSSDPDQPSGAVSIALGPLNPDAIEDIIIDACPVKLTSSEVAHLVGRAQGNPLFAIELARAAATSSTDLPGSIEELIISRIDDLTARERRSVRLASIFGARFELADFRALADSTKYDLEPDLGQIEEIFVVEDGVAAFRQLLYRDAAYSSLPFGRRKRLHKAVGEHLEATVGDLDAISTLLSEHFALAVDRRKCWKYSVQAAGRAERQHSPADAEVLLRRAIGLAPRGLSALERAEAFEALAEVLMKTGSLEEAHDLFAKARSFHEDQAEKLRLQSRQGICRDRQGRYSDALRVFTRVINAGADVPLAQAVAYNGRASVTYRQGRSGEAFDNAKQAFALADAADAWKEKVQALKMLHTAGEVTGEDNFERYADQALKLVRAAGDLSLEAEILNNVGVSAQVAGQIDSAADAYRSSLALMQRVGYRMGAAMVQMNLSEIELDREVTEGVDELLADCIAEFDSVEFTIGSAYSRGLLGRHALLRGNFDEAIGLLRGAADQFQELGAEGPAADMELFLIDAYLRDDQPAAAQELIAGNRLRLAQGNIFDNPEAAAARIDALEQQLA